MVPGTGLLPACVPGAFGAWLLLLRDHGTMSLAEMLAPAIHYAENGYPLVSRITNALQAVETPFRNEWPSSSEIYFPNTVQPKQVDRKRVWKGKSVSVRVDLGGR